MSERIQRVNQLIKKELSQILLREVDFPKDILVTITRVDTSPNLRESKVFISTVPEDKAQMVLNTLNQKIYELQQKINRRLKMRPVPRIKFSEERETAEAGRIEELLEKLKSKR
ncbi:MAG: 30S ribosome-binding factor RbfA [bacterium]|nr:30S ribosome-binding factor RbfA [bacterium]